MPMGNSTMSKKLGLGTILKRVHRDERGGQVSLENVLIIAAIALPILIFIYKFGWPRVQRWWNARMGEIEGDGVQP
jgi:hypothetical protein